MNSLGDPSTERLPIESEVLSRFWKETIFTMLFMGICFTCTTWQIIVSGMMVYRTRKIMHWAVFSAVLFSYSSIIATLISPLLSIGCGVRFWVAIIAIDLSGCCVHTILLYKAYICYNKALWVIVIGLFINMGYIALICIYSTVGKTVSIMDIAGNCSIEGLHWQAYAKLGLDLVSNSFLSLAFLLTIYRHYRLFGSFSLKILLSNGIIFFIGVFASNIITTLLISLDVLHGLTSNMYAIDYRDHHRVSIDQTVQNRKEKR
ncbi:hypothetical protein BDF14DRAFT_1814205 [Spinellus fusiger]|nr:hypothetical protein BDF14DRAFT_1814205 [Spinellus fusiger]